MEDRFGGDPAGERGEGIINIRLGPLLKLNAEHGVQDWQLHEEVLVKGQEAFCALTDHNGQQVAGVSAGLLDRALGGIVSDLSSGQPASSIQWVA